HRVDAVDDAAREEEPADAFEREHPLVPADGEAVDVVAFDVEPERADSLDAVDDEENAALAAPGAERRELRARPRLPIDEAHGDDAGARVGHRLQVVDLDRGPARPH